MKKPAGNLFNGLRQAVKFDPERRQVLSSGQPRVVLAGLFELLAGPCPVQGRLRSSDIVQSPLPAL